MILECLLIAYLVYLLKDMTDRNIHFVNLGIEYEDIPGEITLDTNPKRLIDQKDDDKYNLFSSFCIYLNSKCLTYEEYQNSGIEIVAEQYEIDSEGILSVNRIPLDNISINSLEVKWAKDFNRNSVSILENSFVLKNKSILKGTYGFPNSKWVEISARISSNNFDDSKAYDFEFFQETKNFKSSEYENDAIVSYLETFHWTLLNTSTKISSYSLIKEEVRTNDYYLPRYLIPKTKQFFLSGGGVNEQMKAYDNKNLFVFRYYLNREKNITERNFQDIFTLLSLIGGLAGVVLTVCIIFVFSVRNFRMNEKIINDCYYVLDPNIEELECFNDYLESLFKKLIGIPGNLEEAKKNIAKMGHQMENKSSDQGGIFYNRELDNCNLYSPETPLSQFFNLNRIIDIMDLTSQDLNYLSQNPDLIKEKFNEERNTLKYIIAKIIYDSAKFKSQPDFEFNTCEMFGYMCFNIFCCKKKKKLYQFPFRKNKVIDETDKKKKEVVITDSLDSYRSEEDVKNRQFTTNSERHNLSEDNYHENSNYFYDIEKKYAIYKAGTFKLGIDFDLITILRKISEFEYFTKVILEKNQGQLFSNMNKEIIKDNLDENEENDSNNDDKSETEFHELKLYNKVLYRLTKKDQIKDYHIKLLQLSGISKADIDKFLGLIKKQNQYLLEERLDRSSAVESEKKERYNDNIQEELDNMYNDDSQENL